MAVKDQEAMGTITREIQDQSVYFEGKPLEGWELVGMVQNKKYRIAYYQDKQGNYHHTSVRLKGRYNPFDIKLTEKDGMVFARVEPKKKNRGGKTWQKA